MKKVLVILLLLLFPIMTYAAIKGDVDSNGKVGINDYILVRKHLLSISLLSGDSLTRADVNGDKKITSSDYIYIRKVILGMEEEVETSVEVTSISLNITSLSLDRGRSETLTATINPSDATDKTITWTSSNNSIATVDNGVVKAVASGSATITATSKNGKTATCSVTVKQSNGINRVHFIRQNIAADAILIESNGHFAMVDTGYPSNSNNKTVYNYLNSLGVKELDFVLLTHVHKDHTGGLEYLASRIKIDRIYMKTYIGKDHEPAENKEVYKNIQNVIANNNIPVTYVDKTFSDGQELLLEDMNIKLYNTAQLMDKKEFIHGNENLNSIISLVTVNGKKIFLTADSEDDDIMTKIIKKVGVVDIIKIPHHNFVGCSFLPATARELKPKHIVVTNAAIGTCTEKYFSYTNASVYYVNIISNDAVVFDIGSKITVTYKK